MIEKINDREQLGGLLTKLRAGRPVRDLAAAVRNRIGERDAVSFSTISSWCRGKTVPNPRQFAAFEALLAECGARDTTAWLEAVQRIRGTDAAGPSPYPGLAPFGEADASAFSGRDTVVEEAVACVERVAAKDPGQRLLALVGASGSGKTSLVHAGLIPQLREAGWQTEVIEIGEDPTTALDALDTDHHDRSLVVVDRLEQILRPDVDQTTQHRFLETLTDPRREAVVVLVLRADFYDNAVKHPALRRVLQDQQVLIGPMGEEDLRAAIEGPARAAGSSVPDGLVELVCAEAGRSTGLLPHLSHALQQTWNHGRRGRMSVSDYHAVGGLAGAIEQSAEAAYGELPPAAREATRKIFLSLINVADDGPLTRRVTPRSEIDLITADQDIDLIEHLVDARLLTVSGSNVEIAHETLLQTWPRLDAWLDDARDALKAHAGLREATQLWLAGGRRDADLTRGTALASYRGIVGDDTVAVTDDEREFVAASDAAVRRAEVQQRQRVRRLRSLLAGTAALALVVAILAVVAVVAGRNAAEARDEARTARDNALSRQIAVTAQGLADQDPSAAARLAVAAYRVAPTLEARSAVLNLGNQPLPQRILGGSGSKALALSADGDLVAVSDSAAGTIELLTRDDAGRYHRAGGIEVGSATYALVFAAGDGVLAAGGESSELRLWDVSDPSAPTALGDPLQGPEGAIQRLALDPRGDELAAVGTGDGVYRWDVTSPAAPKKLPTYDVPSVTTWSVAYSPDKRTLAASDDDGRVHLINRGNGRTVSTIQLADQTQSRAIAFSPDGSQLAVTTIIDNHFKVWDISSLREPQEVPEAEGTFTSWVNDVAFSPDGRYAAAGASDATVKVWATDTWAEVGELHHPGIVTQLAMAEDGTLVTVATDGATRTWRLPDDLPVTAPGSVFNVSSSPTTGLVAGVGNGHLQLITPGDDGELNPAGQSSLLKESATGGGTVSPDGRFVTQGHRDGRLELHGTDLADPGTVEIMDDAEFGAVRDVSWSHDSELVAAVGDVSLRFFDLSDPSRPIRTAEFTHESQARTVAWHPSEPLLAVTYNAGLVRLYDASDSADPVVAAEFAESPSELTALAFSPTGDLLAIGGEERTVQLWDVSDPTAPSPVGSPLVGQTAQIQWAAFSPDGSRLVATSNDGTAWVWDVSEPEEPQDYAALGPIDGVLIGVTFDRDGHRVAAGGTNWRVNIWSIDTERVIDRICTDLGAALTEEEWDTHVRGADFVEPC